jgi:fido (protein-threonine AMPylation protein)
LTGVVVVPDRGGQGEDALQDADQNPGRGVPAVVLEAELTLVRVEDRLDALAQWFEDFASRSGFIAFAGRAQQVQTSALEGALEGMAVVILVRDQGLPLALSEADAALGHLSGLGHLIKDPQLLLQPYLTREAVASSAIEGTETSLSEVLQAEFSDTIPNEDVAEVESYVAATRLGLQGIKTLPLTQRLIKQIHQTLLSNVRDKEKLPGEFRVTPVWVGSPTDSPDTAVYVPPLPSEIGDAIIDWENFVNDPPRLPLLIRCGLAHYQFETIHPFLDGNGRIGRLLMGLMLVEQKRLSIPSSTCLDI